WSSDQNSPDYNIYFNRSTNYGVNWIGEFIVDEGGAHCFMPRMIIEGNKVYIAWEDDRHTGSYVSDIFFNYSHDNGSSWLAYPNIPLGPFPGINSRTVNLASEGNNVYASWYDERNWGMGGGDIFVNKSTNSGATWGSEQRVTYGSQPVPLQIQYSVLAAGNNSVTVSWYDQRWYGLPNIYVNNSSDNGTTWLDGMDEADVYCVRSTNGGTSWQTPVKVNDDVGDYAQLLPCVVVKANGMVDVSYYSYRKTVIDPMIPGAEVRMAVSTNMGVSFGSSFPVQDTVVTPSTLWVGEYNGMAVLDTFVYTVFTDFEQNGNSDIYIDRVANPTPSTGCCIGIRGNVDGLGGEPGIDIADLVYFVEFQFDQPPGPAPPCSEEADLDGVSGIDIGDIVYMVDYQFNFGPAPFPCP
ncbi:sialidase family protein, partial [Candidatus Zixiibacteriota bacterium]